jgi:VanZ family protein
MTPPVAFPPAEAPTDSRPDFLVRLGVLLPATLRDIESAYRDKVKLAHPDRGGTVEEFNQLQADYEAACQFAQARQGRRGWLMASIERYIEQQEVVAEIERRGGKVETTRPEWLAREIGEDFAQVADTIEAIRWTGPRVKAAEIAYLIQHANVLGQLRRLDLSGAQIGNAAVESLKALQTLQELDLRGTFVSDRAVPALASIKRLRRIQIANTFVSRWGRFRFRRLRHDVEVNVTCEATHHAAHARRAYRIAFASLIAYWLILWIATHMPLSERLPNLARAVLSWDKLGHAVLYGGLATIAAMVISLRRPDRSAAGLSLAACAAIVLGVSAIGAIDELTQPLTNRQLDWGDWLADTLGATVGVALFVIVNASRRREAPAPALSPAT